jgi:hypothetical protein
MKPEQTWSDYAQFHNELKGYDFLRPTGQPIYRWQLYTLGYKNATDLIQNRTKYKATNRPRPIFEAE